MKPLISISAHKDFQKNRSSQEQDIQAVQSLAGILDTCTLTCVIETSQRTGFSSLELLRHMVREWYSINFDNPNIFPRAGN